MKTNLNNDRSILNDFLKTWTLEKVQMMRLDEYVNTKDPETFCQYVETKTRLLGSINGLNSIKFGIYRRGDKTNRPKNVASDSDYSWMKYYGTKRNDAFKEIKEDLIKIIEAAQKSELENIDDIRLYNIFKWKVAFLYSNEGFIPIFNKDALTFTARNLGMEVTKDTKYSEIHKYIAKKKPIGKSVYDYMRELYYIYREKQKLEDKEKTTKRKFRKGTDKKKTTPQERKGTEAHIAEQFHNELQNKLGDYLSKKFGKSNVIFEENYVDVKVQQPDRICYYEVKTACFAEYCIRQGIGQLLAYSFSEKDSMKKKELVVFGKNRPTSDEIKFISFINKQLNGFDFSYLSLEEIESK